MTRTMLTAKKCTPCQGGIPPMNPDEAQKYLKDAPGWELQDNATKLKQTFKCKNFMEALSLAQEVGELCEEEGHHPDITIGWGYCKVVFQTHKISGLHENDFIMAAKVSQLMEKLAMASRQPSLHKFRKAA